MKTLPRILIVVLVVLSCVGCDQAVKHIAKTSLSTSEPISLMNGVVRLEYAENTGAFLSMGSQLPEPARFGVMVVFTGVVLAAILIYLLRARRITRIQLYGLALLAGGGIGNLIDRISHGAVVDFMSMGIGPVRTGIFNVADVAITAGFVMILLAGVLPSRKQETPPAETLAMAEGPGLEDLPDAPREQS